MDWVKTLGWYLGIIAYDVIFDEVKYLIRYLSDVRYDAILSNPRKWTNLRMNRNIKEWYFNSYSEKIMVHIVTVVTEWTL